MIPTLYDLCLKKQRKALASIEEFKKIKNNGVPHASKLNLAHETRELIKDALQDLDMAYHPNHHEKLDGPRLRWELQEINQFLNP